VEGIYNKTINGVTISDWSIPSVGGFARFNGVDNRPIYPSGYREGTKAFVLENTNKGYGWSANVTLNAQPTEALSLMAAYTHTVAKDVTGMPRLECGICIYLCAHSGRPQPHQAAQLPVHHTRSSCGCTDYP
jgi:hypothetical protein